MSRHADERKKHFLVYLLTEGRRGDFRLQLDLVLLPGDLLTSKTLGSRCPR
jgi:hypothetical protein